VIVDSAKALKEIAGEVLLLRRSQQHGQALISRARLLESLVTRAELATGATRILAHKLGELPPSPAQLAKAVNAIDLWRAALDDDLGMALGGELFAAVQDSVDRVLKDVERRAATTWQRYTAQVTPETSAEILAALAADPSARLTVLTIRRVAERVRGLRDRSIPSGDDITAFESAVSDLRAAWSTLDVASLNDDVVAFLRAANSDRGASLGQLTAPVQTWLAERHLESHYVIRPSDS
jgi:hypothetical protein